MSALGPIVNFVFPTMVVIVGGFCILLLGSTKTLRDSRDDQEKRIAFLEAKSARDDQALASQSGELVALRKVVTGEVYLVAITDLLTEHHAQAVEWWGRLDQSLKHLDATLEARK